MISPTAADNRLLVQVIRRMPRWLYITLLIVFLILILALVFTIIYAVYTGRSVSIWIVTIGEQKESLSERSVIISNDSLAGEWVWSYGQGGWEGSLIFSKGNDDKSDFHGTVREYKNGKEKNILRISDGKAWITKEGLHIECNAQDIENNKVLHWKTVDPLKIGVTFEGSFRSNSPPDSPHSMWGISLRKPFNWTIIPKS